MDLEFKDFEKHPLYYYVDAIVSSYYNVYKKVYLSDALDYQDCLQEAKIQAIITIKKYKDLPLEELKRLVAKSVSWIMQDLRKGALVTQKNVILIPNTDNFEQYMDIIYEKEPNTITSSLFPISDLETVLDKNIYDLFYKMFYEKKTYECIAEEMNCSVGTVARNYQKGSEILRKHLIDYDTKGSKNVKDGNKKRTTK